MAIRALVEGDAVLVQRMYQATTIQDPAELQQLDQEEDRAAAATDSDRLPYVVAQTLYFPYVAGPSFIYGVLGDGPLTSYGQYGPAADPCSSARPPPPRKCSTPSATAAVSTPCPSGCPTSRPSSAPAGPLSAKGRSVS
ncbi:MAG TPA: hypothetical protein VII06_23100 [Chloroflexota bacterium]|jgi:hypothetical protein